MKCPNPKCGNITTFETEAYEVIVWDYTLKLTYENNRALITYESETSDSEYVSNFMTPKNTRCVCPECNFVGPIEEFIENHEGVNHHGFLGGYEHKSMVVYETTRQPYIPLEQQKLREVEPPKPKRVFITWQEAFEKMINTKSKVSRSPWKDGDYLHIDNGVLKDDGGNSYWDRLNQSELQATDWFVVEGE